MDNDRLDSSIYAAFFNMEHLPFERDLPVDSLCKITRFTDVIERLKYVSDNQQFAVLTGDIGTGKSTALRALKGSLDPEKYVVLYVSENNLTPRLLYGIPLNMLGYKPRPYAKDSRKMFQNAIQAEVTLRHKKVVLIVDEAHLVCANKRYETLQEIRFLLNNNCDSDNNIALILAGQNELWDLLGVEKYRAITQRINFVCKLHPLTTDEVFDYISAHMRYSKAPDSIFTTESINLIAAHSKGIPRVINTICKHSLIYAASKNETLINDEIVQAVIDNELPPCAIC